MYNTCCLCNRSYADGGLSIELTEKEIAAIGSQARAVYHYCPVCMKMMSDPQQGAELLSGHLERILRRKGDPAAELRAEHFKKWLLQRAGEKG